MFSLFLSTAPPYSHGPPEALPQNKNKNQEQHNLKSIFQHLDPTLELKKKKIRKSVFLWVLILTHKQNNDEQIIKRMIFIKA